MSYSAMVRRVLVSAPSDVPAEDRGSVFQTVYRWNAIYGEQFSAAVVPLHWSSDVAPEHGVRPQDSLNRQLVDDADGVLALFWHRIGTPTGAAESGTIEEIERAADAGRYVAILQRQQAFPIDVDTEQLARLRDFFDRIKGSSLFLPYETEAELMRHVDTFLTQLVARDQTVAKAVLVGDSAHPQADVWPRVDVRDGLETGISSMRFTRREWSLVLHNVGTAPAKDVSFRLEPEVEGDQVPTVLGEVRPIEVLAPHGEARFPLGLSMRSANQVRCVVTFTDDDSTHQRTATLRML